MTVLQSMYEDQEREVDYVPDYLDYESTPEEHLPELASWTGDWSREQQYSSGTDPLAFKAFAGNSVRQRHRPCA